MEDAKDKAPPVESQEAGGKPKRRVSCLGVLIWTLVALLAAFGLYSLWVRSQTKALSARVRQILAEEDAKRPQLADEDNAAPLYRKAFTLYVGPMSRSKVYGPDKPDPAAVARHLADNAACLEAVRQAVARRDCDFGPLEPFDEKRNVIHYRMDDLVDLLLLAARQKGSAKRPVEALALLEAALRLSRDADRVPFFAGVYPHSWSSLNEGGVCRELRATLMEASPDAETIERFMRKVGDHLAARPGAAQPFRDRQRFVLVYVEDIASGQEASWAGMEWPVIFNGRFRRNLWRASGALVFEARWLESNLGRATASAEKPFPQARAELAKLDDESYSRPPFWAMLRHMQDSTTLGERAGILDGALIRHTRGLAELHLARLAIGCRLHRLKFGACPEKLSDLVEKFPEHFKLLPTDPFTEGARFPYTSCEPERSARISARISSRAADACERGSSGP